MKLPHKTLNYIAQHLPGLAAPTKKTSELAQDKEFTIDELARASDTTVRNIRAVRASTAFSAPVRADRHWVVSVGFS